MIKKVSFYVGLLFVGSSLASCNNPAVMASSQTADAPGGAGSLSEPKNSVAYQLDLVKAGDLEKLKECFTPRVRDGITKELIDKAKADSGKYNLEDLYASEERGEAEGKQTAKVKMKNGRTLTTLIQSDRKWLADTIWFK